MIMKKYYCLFTLLLLTFVGISQRGTNLYAGIEVGSKGVKLSVVALLINTDGAFSYSVKADTAINTEIITFTESAVKESAIASIALYKKAIEYYKIPDRQVAIVMSSGVVKQAQITNSLEKIEGLKELILSQLPNKNKAIDFLTPEMEARLVYLGTINKNDRIGAVIIDVGSGNTKGGYFDSNPNSSYTFTPFDFNWGTAKIKTEINKKNPESISQYVDYVNKFIESIKNDVIAESFNRSPIIRNQPFMIMGGGINWVIATLMHPDKMEKGFVELTIDDIRKFRLDITTNYENMISNRRAGTIEAQIEFEKVKKNFDQKSIIAGSALVETIMRDLSSSSPQKKYYFARYSSWLTGYIVKLKSGEQEIDNLNTETRD